MIVLMSILFAFASTLTFDLSGMYSIDSVKPLVLLEGMESLKMDHGVGSTDHFSALKIWMFENKFVSLPSHLKTIEPMARPIREKSGTGVYHVMLRGINRQDIFEDEEDYLQMTSILRGLTDRYWILTLTALGLSVTVM